ncbi:unnamed protein product [Rhodiola kirilowii]
MPFCDYCEYEQAGVSNDIGALYCSNCGKTIGEEHFSDEPTFNKGPGGVSTIQGTLTRIRQNESNSLLMSRRRGSIQRGGYSGQRTNGHLPTSSKMI